MEKLYQDLIKKMVNSGLTPVKRNILNVKGKELGLDQESIDILIEMESNSSATIKPKKFKQRFINFMTEPILATANSLPDENKDEKELDSKEVEFRSAITRGGGILTPDRLIISDTYVTYRKRNKHLINVDTLSIPISKISSIKLDTGILGTNIIIKSYGSGEILAKRFTKSDAKKIEKLVKEKMRTI